MILFMQNGTGQYADKVSEVELRTTVPAPLAIQSVKSKGGSCSTTGQTIHCDFGQLAEGERVEAAITVVPSEEGTYRFDVGWITDGACCIAMGPSLMVRIGGANQPPVAIGDLILIGTKSTKSINVLKNDSDPDGDPIRVLRWRTPTSGTAKCVGAICTYTKGPKFPGNDSFQYTITDDRGGTSSARVKIRLAPQKKPNPKKAATFTIKIRKVDAKSNSVVSGGVVISNPPGMYCPLSCTAHYRAGTVVKLLPVATENWGFAYWSGDCAAQKSAHSCSLKMDRNHFVDAAFGRHPSFEGPSSIVVVNFSATRSYLPGEEKNNCKSPLTCVLIWPRSYTQAMAASSEKPDSGSGFWETACEVVEAVKGGVSSPGNDPSQPGYCALLFGIHDYLKWQAFKLKLGRIATAHACAGFVLKGGDTSALPLPTQINLTGKKDAFQGRYSTWCASVP
jgi:hypothetical protein